MSGLFSCDRTVVRLQLQVFRLRGSQRARTTSVKMTVLCWLWREQVQKQIPPLTVLCWLCREQSAEADSSTALRNDKQKGGQRQKQPCRQVLRASEKDDNCKKQQQRQKPQRQRQQQRQLQVF